MHVEESTAVGSEGGFIEPSGRSGNAGLGLDCQLRVEPATRGKAG